MTSDRVWPSRNTRATTAAAATACTTVATANTVPVIAVTDIADLIDPEARISASHFGRSAGGFALDFGTLAHAPVGATRTSDGGKSWVEQESGTRVNLYGLSVAKKDIWVVGAEGLVLKYVDR